MKKVELKTLQGGAVFDLFNEEMEKVVQNVDDENTEATATRSITIVLEIKPSKTRRDATTKLVVSSKLAKMKPTESTMYFDRENGSLVALEENLEQSSVDFQNAKVGGM